MTRLSLHIALAALLLAPAAVLGQGASEDAQEDAPWHLLFSGRSWGLGSSSSTGDTILLLYEQLDAQGGSTRIVRSSHSLAADGRFFLADAAGGPREVLAILRAKGNIKREVLRERVSAVESDRAIIVQHPANPHLDVATLMERRNRRVPRDPSLRRVDLRLVRMSAGGKSALLLERHDASAALKRDPMTWNGPAWVIEGEARHGAVIQGVRPPHITSLHPNHLTTQTTR